MTTDLPKNGQRVRFRDRGNVRSDGKIAIREGVVNGEPLSGEVNGKTITHIPVWAERDNGREATTIFVHVENILGEGEEA